LRAANFRVRLCWCDCRYRCVGMVWSGDGIVSVGVGVGVGVGLGAGVSLGVGVGVSLCVSVGVGVGVGGFCVFVLVSKGINN